MKMAFIKVMPLVCFLVCVPVSWSYNASDTSGATTPLPDESFVKKLQGFFASAMDNVSPDLTRKLLTAQVSPTCSLGLLKLVSAIRRAEPWALRLIDAMGKYPSGLMQASKADLGAFDECVETVVHDSFGNEAVRAQYCNLDFRISKGSSFVESTLAAIQLAFPKVVKFRDHLTDPRLPPIRLGICVTNDCNEEELEELINKALPLPVDLKISNCVTSLPVPLTKGQKAIFIVIGVLVALLVFATITDICVHSRTERNAARGILVRLLTAFSLISNTRTLLHTVKDKSSDAYILRFFHGLRFFSLVWIVLGHCYGAISPTYSRLLNNLIMAEHIQSLVVPAAYVAVDTFFFLSAYLMCHAISKQKRQGAIVFIFAVVRRFIRTMVPVFFVLMCMYLLPVMTSGPDAKTFFDRFYGEMDHIWLDILLQVQNYKCGAFTILVHLWYLSVDFQLFLVALPIVMILKNRRRWAIAVFVVLSIVSCGIAAWQITGTHVTPFVVVVTQSMSILEDTLSNFYFLPFYHSVCYFSGCIAFFLLQGFRDFKVPKIGQAVAWFGAAGCGMCCIFAKYPWYMERNPTSEFGNICMAFFDRIMWSLLLLWITLACATGRGGYLNSFLSWNAFVPLSRLTFGVYLIHAPFIFLVLHISRERILYSHFTLVSMCFSVLMWSHCLAYLAFVLCEAPTAQLDKLIFMGGRRGRKRPAAQHSEKAVATEMVEKGQSPVDLENGKNIAHNGIGNSVTHHL